MGFDSARLHPRLIFHTDKNNKWLIARPFLRKPWTTEKATEVRKELDTLGVRCYSTHNDLRSFSPDGINKAIELNKILGTHYIVMAYPGQPKTADDWKKVADTLNKANDTMKAQGLNAGYHNHDA